MFLPAESSLSPITMGTEKSSPMVVCLIKSNNVDCICWWNLSGNVIWRVNEVHSVLFHVLIATLIRSDRSPLLVKNVSTPRTKRTRHRLSEKNVSFRFFGHLACQRIKSRIDIGCPAREYMRQTTESAVPPSGGCAKWRLLAFSVRPSRSKIGWIALIPCLMLHKLYPSRKGHS